MSILASRIKTFYANLRIQPTVDESRSHNSSDKILLTFDDFADIQTVKSILVILKKENVKAVFFLIGDLAKKNLEVVLEIEKNGHFVGNHTKTHANLLKLSENEIIAEILGGPSSTLLRPPYGKYNKKIREIAKTLGYKICYWDVDSDDWQGISPKEIVSRVAKKLHPGACILMHLNGLHTVEALPFLIKEIRNKGYKICSIGDEVIYG